MPIFNLELFLQTIQAHKIAFIHVPPPVFDRPTREEILDQYDLSSVRMIASGVAPLTTELVDAVHERLNVKINQAYGLSDASPMTNTQTWGEYSEATKDSIDPDGFLTTGDVGFQDKDGNFYTTDRVTPAEAEGKLTDHPNVNDVAVIGVHDDKQHTEVPRAYVVPAKRRGNEHADEIAQWTSDRVATHKWLRGGVVFIDDISASGKILRRILKDRARRDTEGKVKAKL